MNKVIKQECVADLFGLKGRAHNVVMDDETKIIRNQKISLSRLIEDGRITVKLRFDDELGNGHESFSITGTLYDKRGKWEAWGCLHDHIAKYFPSLEPLVKWHLCSVGGPMHYIGNVVYLAGEKDCWGRAKGEPSSYDTVVYFDDVPFPHKVGDKFWKWLQTINDFSAVHVEEIERPKKPEDTFDYGPKYTLSGYMDDIKWYECPFDSKQCADDFLASLRQCKVRFDKVPTAFSKGKERELDKARRCAIWLDATDEELSVSKEELTEKLNARLPGLLKEFKEAMLSCGFIWPEREETK